MLDVIRSDINASIAAKKDMLADKALLRQLAQFTDAFLSSLKSGSIVIFAGNEGGFAVAPQEFTSRFIFDRAPLELLALDTDNSSIRAIGDDYGYEQVLSRGLKVIAHTADFLFPYLQVVTVRIFLLR